MSVRKGARKKYNIVLDLDQTLLSAENLRTFDFKTNAAKMRKFEHVTMGNDYIVFLRPHLQKFLDFCFANFNVAVWTAAGKSYGTFIVNNIILAGRAERKLDFFFYAHHCKLSTQISPCIKDLNVLWDIFKVRGYSSENTVIIDDNPEVYKCQLRNSFIAPPFYFHAQGSEKDEFLPETQHFLTRFLQKKRQ